MKYDFTSHIERKGHDAIAVDMLGQGGGFAPGAPKEGFDAIPMWVADMNFPVVPTIQEAMTERITQGILFKWRQRAGTQSHIYRFYNES